MDTYTVTFHVEKDTKNTVRFQEVDNTAGVEKVIGPLYVQKDALNAMGYRQGETVILEFKKEVK